jgi:hypothetical protein
MPFIRPVAFLEHRSEILYEKGGEEQKFGEHTRPGCGAWRPRRARKSIGSKADNANYRDHREDYRAKVTSLVAIALSGETPDNHTRGRVCSPIPTAGGMIGQQPVKLSTFSRSFRNCLLSIALASFALVSALPAAPPTPVESPGAAPVPAGTHSLKKTVPVESVGDSVVARHTGFEVVPGKDPNGWSFILEPYLWGLGVDGTVGVKRFDTHVDYNPVTVVKHLDWGIMAKGEVRKGKWGILGDGFFAQLSASGDPPGPLYNSANIKLQQGMAELALAYRIIDDRRGFLDIYAGARYNYFGIDVDASIDKSGIRNVSNDASQRIFSAVGTRVQSAVDAEVQKLRAGLSNEVAIVENDARNQIAAGLESDLQTRLRRELASSHPLRAAVRAEDILRIAKGVRGEYRAFLEAVLDERIAQDRARLGVREADAVARARARVAQAENRLSKALSKELQNRLPTSKSGDDWWVDPIIGLRTQINFTRWLFLALQGDVGGFGAGSQIAWFASGSIGINFTRNLFMEMGYRYFYMDYVNNGLTYDAAQSGLFMGAGVKF